MKKAILFGASGFIGSYLLEALLANPDYEQVIIVVRKDLNINHPRLKMLLGDYRSLPDLSASLVADDVFIALGTTKKSTPDTGEYYQIDHDYPVMAARIAKENGAKSVFLVSAVGANANSGIFYVKTKGETERDIIVLDFEHTHIFRPSMLMGNRKANRPLEKILIKIWTVINPLLIGRLDKYRGIKGEEVAKAMNNAATMNNAASMDVAGKNQTEKVRIYQWKEMNDIGKSGGAALGK